MNAKIKAGLAIVFSLILAIPVAYAADLVVPEKGQQSQVIGANENHHNLYTAGGNVTVNGQTKGDIAVAGGMVSLEGAVEQDAMVAGGTLTLNGPIGGDARVGGGNITVNSQISGDLVIGGGNVNISSKASIGGDLIMGAGNGNIETPVKGTARIGGGNITINSKIEGNVWVQTNQRLVFGPQADISGQVYYKGPQEAEVKSGAKVPNIHFTKVVPRGYKHELAGIFTAFFLIKLLAWVVVGLLLIRFKKNRALDAFNSFKNQPWQGLGWGVVSLIVVPVLTVLLLVSTIGYYLAGLLAIGFVFLLAIAGIMSAIVLGYWVMSYLNRTNAQVMGWQTVVVGVILYNLIGLIPFVGWLALAILFVIVFGHLMRATKESFNN